MRLPKLIRQTAEQIRQLYLRDSIPWVIGCSWGKDSSCTLQLVWQAIAALEPEQRHKQIDVITTDTGVENPIIATYVRRSIQSFNLASTKQQMPITAHLLRPSLDNSFWVLTIGKGYSKPSYRHRWCTPRLKIEPSDRFIRQQVSRYGESILILGVRKDESVARKASIERHQKEGWETNLSPSSSLINSTIYTPIADWTTSEVWQYLLQVENPWGGNNQELFNLYRGATDSTECPLVLEENTGSCGKSRFGCYVCTVVQAEASLSNTIKNNEEMEWLEPLLNLREKLSQSNQSDRQLRMTTKGVQFHQNRVNSQLNLEPTPGKYHQTFRAELLHQLLTAQGQIRAEAPQEYRQIELITSAELSEIRYLWLYHHHEIEDLLPQIYESATGDSYVEAFPERFNSCLNSDYWSALNSLGDDSETKLVASLLAITLKHQTPHLRGSKYQALNECIRQNMSDKAEAIYLGYRQKCLSLTDSQAIRSYIKLMARPIPVDKIMSFQ